MPHKRAKSSVRKQEQKERGNDLPPQKDSLSNEPIPKSASRILNAAMIRQQYKKRKNEDDGDHKQRDKRRRTDDGETGLKSQKDSQTASKLTIKPGESIQHFNRRVEDDLRPLVKAAVQTSNAAVRNAYKAEKDEKLAKKKEKETDNEKKVFKIAHKPSSPPAPVDKHANKAKEFERNSTSAPRRLNDIAQAPPEFKRLPRGVSSESGLGGKRDGVLSMAQKQMMDKERENAIARYRELKSRQRNTGDKAGGED
ncbi:hypothetical protein H0H92_013770 [Tricholoma furcatifolium]|nr:hypothetical protein H0H92_013770 [Tricholoma furcatifolium]